jgi:hypothetical protein
MKTRLLLAIAILASVAACKIGGDETTTGAGATCAEVGTACAENRDCCSYGCLHGICVANQAEGGACVTSNDCASGRLCKSGGCTTPTLGMCRDTGDVCSTWSSCCSGNCEGGDCTTNRAPTADAGDDVLAPPGIPYTQPFTLANRSADPDLDPLTFGWSLVQRPAGSQATLTSATGATPSFTPDVSGTYVVRLVVSEGPTGAPDRYTLEDQVTLVAVNRAPLATASAPAPADERPRNVPLRITGAASDADGDAIDCEWRVTAPGDTTPTVLVPFAPCTNPSAPVVDYTPTGEGLYHVDLVVRDHDRVSGAVVNVTTGTATFTSINNPPTPVLTPSSYYANLNGPPVALDASQSWDMNGDTMSFAWEPLTWPDQGTGAPAPALGTTNPMVATFTPAASGDYTVRLTVSDPPFGARPSSSTSIIATVHVDREVTDLGPINVVDADVAHGFGTSGLAVLVGPDPSTPSQGMIWKLDLASGNLEPGTSLGQPPTVVGVSPDGTLAVAASASWVYIVPLDGSAVRPLAQGSVKDIVVTGPDQGGKRRAFVFLGSSTAMKTLDLSTDTWSTTSVYGDSGSLDTVGDRLYVRDSTSLRKYAIGGGGALNYAAYGSYSKTCTGLWASRNPETHIFTGCGDVVPVPPLLTTLTVSETLPSSAIAHLDTSSDGAGVYVSSDRTRLGRFNSQLAPLSGDVLPRWSWDGQDRAASARFTFTDGNSRWAIVSGMPGGSSRHGIVTFP